VTALRGIHPLTTSKPVPFCHTARDVLAPRRHAIQESIGSGSMWKSKRATTDRRRLVRGARRAMDDDWRISTGLLQVDDAVVTQQPVIIIIIISIYSPLATTVCHHALLSYSLPLISIRIRHFSDFYNYRPGSHITDAKCSDWLSEQSLNSRSARRHSVAWEGCRANLTCLRKIND